MPLPIISVDKLSKSYRLYAKPSDRLKEVLMPWRSWHAPFFALQDVSFDIQPGEHLGILGVNGAGKSTLLQVLTGVLTPTGGTAEVRGRVAALLELGAGFNPQLTGRENALFHLRLHSFPEEQIEQKVAEIEAFAEVGEFFDQPMKTYSSGMYVRVAFAAAILVEPDVLIVDEALAVGDARFQKKCHDRLHALKQRGTTVILVTHDIFGAKKLCSRLILLDKGRLVANGEPEDVITQYMRILYPKTGDESELESAGLKEGAPLVVNTGDSDLEVNVAGLTNRWGRGGAVLVGMRFKGLLPPNRFIKDQKITIECDYQFDPAILSELAVTDRVISELAVGMRIDAPNGTLLCDLSSAVANSGRLDFDISKDTFGTFQFEVILPNMVPGEYFFTPAVSVGNNEANSPVVVYENAASIQCEHTEMILGLFKPDYQIKRIQ